MEKEHTMTLTNISEWPCLLDGGRYICVIRKIDGVHEYGFILSGSWDVNLGYIWEGGTGHFAKYNSAEEVLADGWEID